jgi:hypothetical protein
MATKRKGELNLTIGLGDAVLELVRAEKKRMVAIDRGEEIQDIVAALNQITVGLKAECGVGEAKKAPRSAKFFKHRKATNCCKILPKRKS